MMSCDITIMVNDWYMVQKLTVAYMKHSMPYYLNTGRNNGSTISEKMLDIYVTIVLYLVTLSIYTCYVNN